MKQAEMVFWLSLVTAIVAWVAFDSAKRQKTAPYAESVPKEEPIVDWKKRKVNAPGWCTLRREDAEKFLELLSTQPKQSNQFLKSVEHRKLVYKALVQGSWEPRLNGLHLMRVREAKHADCWTWAVFLDREE